MEFQLPVIQILVKLFRDDSSVRVRGLPVQNGIAEGSALYGRQNQKIRIQARGMPETIPGGLKRLPLKNPRQHIIKAANSPSIVFS